MKIMNRPNFTIRGIDHQILADIDAMQRAARSGWARHVIRLHDVLEENQHVYLRMELCTCDLLQYTNSQPWNRLTEAEAAPYMKQLCAGLSDLHELGVLHRDLKPENLLIAEDGGLRIADFGWCAYLKDSPSSLAGTFQYMAPEVLAQKPQTEAADVWSAGVTMLQLILARPLLTTYLGHGATGLSATDPNEATRRKLGWLLQEVLEKLPPSESAKPLHVSSSCWDLFRQLLIPEVALRATLEQAQRHRWLQQTKQGRKEEDSVGQIRQESFSTEKGAGAAPSAPVLRVPTPFRNSARRQSKAEECRKPPTELPPQIKELDFDDDSVEISEMLPSPKAAIVLPPTDTPTEDNMVKPRPVVIGDSIGTTRAFRLPLRATRPCQASNLLTAREEHWTSVSMDRPREAGQACSVMLQHRRHATPEFSSVQLCSPMMTARMPVQVPFAASAIPRCSGHMNQDLLARTLPGRHNLADGRLNLTDGWQAWSLPATPVCPSPVTQAPASARFGWSAPSRVFPSKPATPLFTPRPAAMPSPYLAHGRSIRRL